MVPCRRSWRRVLLAGLVLSLSLLASSAGGQDARAGRPRLAVLVVFDQMRADYLTRWEDLFSPDGFGRLLHEGAWFQNCHYPYADTVTAAGHASLATGTSPDRHGIVGNEWYDRAAGEMVYCVATDRYQLVPSEAEPDVMARKKKTQGGVSPERLLAPTLADALKEATHDRGRVVSLSFKDRSAVLLGGRRPDACYWIDAGQGIITTCTYYRDRLHPWAAALNRERPADRWFGRTWDRLRPDLDYARYSGPDDVPAEGTGYLQGRTFPHAMAVGTKPGKLYYESLYNSPFGNELLLDVVKRAIDAEQLGTHDDPDLLCVSFSSNDPIGHCWGPDSQEVLDVTLRSDRIIQALLAHLDARVGKGAYLLALSADHGICPLPDVARAHGHDAGRVPATVLSSAAEAFLDQTYGPPKAHWVEAASPPWIYLNRRVVRERGLQLADVQKTLADWLKQQPGVQTAYTRVQLLEPAGDDPVLAQVRRSFHPMRSGDVTVILKPYYLFTSNLIGTTHGTPHDYDTHVPLLVYGPGIAGGPRREAVTPQAATAILAEGVEIKAPAGAEAAVPSSLASGVEKAGGTRGGDPF